MTREQFAALKAKRSPSKYKNKKKMIDGIEFDSTKEARRYQDLVLMQKAGQIYDLRRQVPYSIFIKGKLICEWIADFVYNENADEGRSYYRRVEDCKGFRTDIYRLKKKMVEAEYNIKILES